MAVISGEDGSFLTIILGGAPLRDAVGEGFAEVDFGLPLPVRCAAIVTLGVADVEGILCAGGEFEGFEGAISTYDDLS